MNDTFFGTLTNWIQGTVIFVLINIMLVGCEAEDPIKEDIPELITKITLTFAPIGGGAPVTATASDPDGDGVADIEVDNPINLSAGTTYVLTLSLINELAEQSSPEYDITEEVKEEGDEHMLFFGWTNNVFADPTVDGNIDNRSDVVNYIDLDNGGLPIGITTSWTTASPSSGTFRVVLKHQPQLKTLTSDVTTGETDLDVQFEVNVN